MLLIVRNDAFVVPGLDPRIHHLQEMAIFSMDCRIKPGSDSNVPLDGFAHAI